MLQVKFYHGNWNHKLKCWRIDFLQCLKKSFRIAVGILTCQKCRCRKLALTFYKSTWRPVFVFPFNHQSCLYELNTSDKTRLSLYYFEYVIRNALLFSYPIFLRFQYTFPQKIMKTHEFMRLEILFYVSSHAMNVK